MIIRGIIFDVNGTLIDIHTDEGYEEIYRGISHFLTYQGVRMHRWEVRDEYYRIMDEQKKASQEKHAEFDAVEVWREFLRRKAEHGLPVSASKLKQLPRFLAEMYRGLSRFKLQTYPEVHPVLAELAQRFRLAALSDAQSAWALPELRAVGLSGYFDPIVVSGDLGYRKPDPRIFRKALDGMGLAPEEVLFVGNDMYRDVYGARQMGMKTIFFRTNQGRQKHEGTEPDYIIYSFGEMRGAVNFFLAQAG